LASGAGTTSSEEEEGNASINDTYSKYINLKTMTLILTVFIMVGAVLSIIYIIALKYVYNTEKRRLSKTSLEEGQPVVLGTGR